MTQEAPQSPEARRRLATARARLGRHLDRIRSRSYGLVVVKRVVSGVYAEGFTHAGNLAFMALLTLFPFFIVLAALAQVVGQTESGLSAVSLFLQILRQAYGTPYGRPFYEYRLYSIGLIILAVAVALLGFTLQFVLTGIEQAIRNLFPVLESYRFLISISRIVPGFVIFGSLYLVFWSLTPRSYRSRVYPKWPGALLVTVWWIGTTALMPLVLSMLISYDLTYGSLAGVMLALIFFYIIGFGVVFGAQLNAALAEVPETEIREKAADAKKAAEEKQIEEP
ncbi:MAG: YihY/virulence factor BrkB family protein [Sphingomonadales bacterium]|nr:YihY/virulence factor BrkB family protein [Sphingomonadales bacterium]